MYIIANMNHFNLLCAIVKSFSNIERLSLQTEMFAEAVVPIQSDQDPESHPQFCTSSLQDQLMLFSLSDNRLTIYSEFSPQQSGTIVTTLQYKLEETGILNR